MARFYLDEHIGMPMKAILAACGHDVLHTNEAGNRGAPDSRQLLFAAETGRVLVTLNREDYEELHRWWVALNEWALMPRPHAGILTTWGDISANEFGPLIDSLLQQQPDMTNRMMRYNQQLQVWRSYPPL